MHRLIARGAGRILAKRNTTRGSLRPCAFFASHNRRQYGTKKSEDSPVKLTSDHCSGNLADVAKSIRERVDVDFGYNTVPKPRDHLLKYQPKLEELPTRSMLDSHTTVVLPLGSDEYIRERYVNYLGRVRMGRVMEELDMMAVWLCHRHVLLPNLPKDVPLPYTFVTLLVDKVEFSNIERLKANYDIHLSGHVSWTGRSSMETTIYVQQLADGEYIDVTRALFLMVARNATNTGSAPVNPLKPADETEKAIWKEAEQRQKQRRAAHTESVLNSPPREHEQAIMYNLLKRTTIPDNMDLNRRVLPPKCRWMQDSQQTTMISPFPENRNAQNTIFGGYIMRQAVEISFIMASIYLRGRPILHCISDISFLSPVRVNTFLQMTAYVVYTNKNYVQLMTVAHIWDVQSGEDRTTNIFYLTYKADKIVDEVLPRSYREMLLYVHGRRKLLAALKLDPQYPDDTKETDAKPKATENK
ncbi:acyl-coenzyme A thioesterase 9, mitochondrial [Drosophila pseudoobscura]|uniref:Acyl-coenzyme A thioesterase 9, mitochondrial n=1 Tax=Drosophila pseudoobscura pseudoobscura TaxID=46245 RepID=A0A6I8V274_DROPS|nr:acyl-coenzyme A thioesterase 9, mitochondrial [Drosophila pseudoobscura]